MSPKRKQKLVLSDETAAKLVPRLQLPKGVRKLAAAIDHGGTHPRFGVFDEAGEPVLKLKGEKEPLSGGLRLELPTYERMPEGLSSSTKLPKYMAEKLATWLKPVLSQVAWLGYAMAGPVTEDGVQVNTPNIWGPEVTNVPWQAMLERKLGMKGRVALGNDMWAAANDIIARGEKLGYDVDNFIVITVSSGIGSKVVRNRKVDLGAGGLAGEIGHLPILWPDETIPGRRCGCGRLYCLEAGSSGNSNAHRAKTEVDRLWPQVGVAPSAELMRTINGISLEPGDDLDERMAAINEAVVEAALGGNPLGSYIIRRTVRPIARAVAALESQLNIRNFYFVGGFALALGDLLLQVLREEIIELGGISGRSAEQIQELGRLYRVTVHDWGLRGAALGAKLAFDTGK
ncbi:MAG: ROK family protein [Armatimonadetes bacterium]|nr:ROK family protein [Armatimonadota bacterium]